MTLFWSAQARLLPRTRRGRLVVHLEAILTQRGGREEAGGVEELAAKGGLELEAVVGWLQVWGISTFVHTLLPHLLALVIYKKPVSLDKRTPTNSVATPTNSVATAQATSTVPFSPAAGGGGGGAGGVDRVARKVGGVLVKLSSDRHLGLGLAVGINYIIDPLIASLAYRADPGPTAGGAGTPPPPPTSSTAGGGGEPSAAMSAAGSVHSACGETMAVISRVAERLGEPTVGNAIMPRLLSLLSAADKAFPNANAGSRHDQSDKSDKPEAPGKGAAASLLSLRADLLGVSGTRGTSAAKKHDGQAGQELKDLDGDASGDASGDAHEPLSLFSTSLFSNSSAAAGAAVAGARHMDDVVGGGGGGGGYALCLCYAPSNV